MATAIAGYSDQQWTQCCMYCGSKACLLDTGALLVMWPCMVTIWSRILLTLQRAVIV